ncbi:hypothetical protein NL676_021549 [Syzygium grande]|nr:hypothetical protein NL676_021549 [Syzygium grande]
MLDEVSVVSLEVRLVPFRRWDGHSSRAAGQHSQANPSLARDSQLPGSLSQSRSSGEQKSQETSLRFSTKGALIWRTVLVGLSRNGGGGRSGGCCAAVGRGQDWCSSERID